MNATLWSSGEPVPGKAYWYEGNGKDITAAIMDVWACWVEVFQPRRAIMDKVQRDIIKGALEVASVEECRTAIRELYASDYHQKRGKYEGRTGNKYNNIRHALKGRPRRGESTRERIDWWLDRAEEREAAKPESYLEQQNAAADRILREQGLI